MKSGLRWEAQVRTNNGAITTYVRVRAHDASQAVRRAQQKAFNESVKQHPQYSVSDWFVIFLGLHDDDQNSLGKV